MVKRDGNQSGSRKRPASQGHPSRGGTTVSGGTKKGGKPKPYVSTTPSPAPAPRPDITLGGDRHAERVTGHQTKRQRIRENRRKRRVSIRQILDALKTSPGGHPSRGATPDPYVGIPSPAAASELAKESRRTARDLDRLFAPESKVKRAERTEAAERLESRGLVTLPSTVAHQARQANKYRLRRQDDDPDNFFDDAFDTAKGAVKSVIHAHTPLGRAERDASRSETARVIREAIEHPEKAAHVVSKGLGLAAAVQTGSTRDLQKAGVDPADAVKYLDVPLHVGRALVTSGKARRETVESVPGLLAGLIPGTLAAVADPVKAFEAFKADLRERYGEGRYEDILKGMERHGGIPYALDIGGVTSLAGRAATPAARLAARTRAARRGREIRNNLIDRSRPDLQIAPGIRRHQAASQNLIELLGQRGLDELRRRNAERRAGNPDPDARRGIQADDRDAVPALTIRSQDRLLKRHQEGRHGRNVIEYRQVLKHVLSRHRRELARLSKQERKGFADALELGLPAATSGDAIAAGRAAIEDRMNQIDFTRRERGVKLSRADKDELNHLADLHRNYAATFTPELRALADEARRTAKRVGLSDPGLVDEQVVLRTLGPQARVLREELPELDDLDPAARGEGVREFVARVEAARKARGLEPAGYFPHTDHRYTRNFSVMTGGSGLRAVAGPKATRYRLFDEGRVSRDPARFEDAISRGTKRAFNWRSVADAMDAYARVKGKTLHEIADYMRDHDLSPQDWVAVNPVKFRASWRPRADGDVEYGEASLREAWTASRIHGTDERALDDPYADDASWALIPKAVSDTVEQGRTQFGEGKLARAGSKVWKGLPSKLILGTNPSWAVIQVINDAYLAALAGINPGTIIKAERYFRGQVRPGLKSKAHERRMERAMPFAGASGFSRELYGTRMGSQAGRVGEVVEGLRSVTRAWSENVAGRVPGGYKLRDSGLSANPLDWLFQFDQSKANVFRRAVLYDDLRRQAYAAMGDDVRGWMRTATQLDDLTNAFGRGPVEGIDALLRSDRALEQAAEHVDRALGNFMRFGPRERRFMERNIMFYGFLRFSLRFTFLTLPRDHPIIASIQAHLSQLHEDEVRRLLGVKPGDPLAPGLLAKYFLVGEGGELLEVPLARANPALNALTTAGTLGDVPQALVTTLPPLAQELLGQAFEEAPFTGKDWLVSGEAVPRQSMMNRQPYTLGQRGRIFLNDLLSVMAPYRTLRELNAGHSPTSVDSFAWDPRFTEYRDEDIATDVELQRRYDLARPDADVIRDSLVLPLIPRESRERDRERRYLEDLGRITSSPEQEALERIDKFEDPEYLDLWIDNRLRRLRHEQDRKLSRYGL